LTRRSLQQQQLDPSHSIGAVADTEILHGVWSMSETAIYNSAVALARTRVEVPEKRNECYLLQVKYKSSSIKA
jgi:hypothetical protein